MRKRLLVVALVAATAAWTAACDDEEIDYTPVRQHGIVNGQLAAEGQFPSVVALGGAFGSDPSAMCSANLVTPRVLISAAHCGADIPVELIKMLGVAYFGNDVTDADEEIGFEDFQYHPDYVPLEGAELGQFDLSVFVLKEDATAEPTWFRRGEVTDDDEGAEMTSVGFGVTSADGGGSGIKRYATIILYAYDENFLLSFAAANPDNANICSGDSGGPQFFYQDGFYVEGGVHSWGDANCVSSAGSTRVDIAAEWFLDRIEEVHGSRDVCEINGWYGDSICHPFCDLEDPDCAAPEDAGLPDAGGPEDGGAPDAGDALASTGGCGCAIVPGSTSGSGSLLVLALAGLLALARRRAGS